MAQFNDLDIPENIKIIKNPPYMPEMNPIANMERNQRKRFL